MGGRAAHQLPQSVLLSLHVPAEARPRLKARTRVRKSMVSALSDVYVASSEASRGYRLTTGRRIHPN